MRFSLDSRRVTNNNSYNFSPIQGKRPWLYYRLFKSCDDKLCRIYIPQSNVNIMRFQIETFIDV